MAPIPVEGTEDIADPPGVIDRLLDIIDNLVSKLGG
jgi:hypothetical protein